MKEEATHWGKCGWPGWNRLLPLSERLDFLPRLRDGAERDDFRFCRFESFLELGNAGFEIGDLLQQYVRARFPQVSEQRLRHSANPFPRPSSETPAGSRL